MTEKTWPERSKRPATPAVLNDEGRMMRKRQKTTDKDWVKNSIIIFISYIICIETSNFFGRSIFFFNIVRPPILHDSYRYYLSPHRLLELLHKFYNNCMYIILDI